MHVQNIDQNLDTNSLNARVAEVLSGQQFAHLTLSDQERQNLQTLLTDFAMGDHSRIINPPAGFRMFEQGGHLNNLGNAFARVMGEFGYRVIALRGGEGGLAIMNSESRRDFAPDRIARWSVPSQYVSNGWRSNQRTDANPEYNFGASFRRRLLLSTAERT